MTSSITNNRNNIDTLSDSNSDTLEGISFKESKAKAFEYQKTIHDNIKRVRDEKRVKRRRAYEFFKSQKEASITKKLQLLPENILNEIKESVQEKNRSAPKENNAESPIRMNSKIIHSKEKSIKFKQSGPVKVKLIKSTLKRSKENRNKSISAKNFLTHHFFGKRLKRLSYQKYSKEIVPNRFNAKPINKH